MMYHSTDGTFRQGYATSTNLTSWTRPNIYGTNNMICGTESRANMFFYDRQYQSIFAEGGEGAIKHMKFYGDTTPVVAVTGLTLSGTHAGVHLDTKKKKRITTLVTGPTVEQLIPVEFTFNTQSGLVRYLKETVRIKATLIRNSLTRIELRLNIVRDAIGSSFKVSSPLKTVVEAKITIKAKTLRNLRLRNENIKKFLLRKLVKVLDDG